MQRQQPTALYARNLLSYLHSRPDYDTWIKVISAIANEFDESVALDILLSHFKDEKPNEHLYKIRNRLRSVGFGTLIYFAKQYGWNGNAIKTPTRRPKPQEPSIKIIKTEPPIYSFADLEYEERAGFKQDSGKSRTDAERQTIYENPKADCERLYRVAVNKKIINRNCEPRTGAERKEFNTYTNFFKNTTVNLKGLINCIGNGHPVCFARLKENERGECVRKKANFDGAEMLAIDIDNEDDEQNRKIDGYLSIEKALSLPETENALLLYTTVSNSPTWERYRIVFALNEFCKSENQIENRIKDYIDIYGADANPKDATRGHYGNSNSKIYSLTTNEIYYFKNGILKQIKELR